jgi:hypothetical protein
MMRLLFALIFLVEAAAAAVHTEIGEINGATFRIDIPEK